ncbi:hypothetical protein ABT297_02275 [Dactylosporangium sp. NPDC000555]|uniref:hypothetical protein n=1 Tax=Dactylosporangium sp. NPDC000555 TaxID=3154260 RepID=UPI00331A1F42
MDGLRAMLFVGAVLAVILGSCVLLARRIRRRGLGGGLMNVAEEIYLPSARRSRVEIQAQVQRTTPSPGDPLRRARGADRPR